MTTTLEVLAPGPLATVQDLGRPGLAALGVGRSGAADRAALRLANRLVGNPEDAAALELTFGGLRLRTDAAVTLALTGAPCPLSVGGRAAGMNAPLSLRPGEELELGTPTWGTRTYLAARGGIDVPEVLGSRSTDTLAGLGPPPLRAATLLPLGTRALHLPRIDQAPVRLPAPSCASNPAPGPTGSPPTRSPCSTPSPTGSPPRATASAPASTAPNCAEPRPRNSNPKA